MCKLVIENMETKRYFLRRNFRNLVPKLINNMKKKLPTKLKKVVGAKSKGTWNQLRCDKHSSSQTNIAIGGIYFIVSICFCYSWRHDLFSTNYININTYFLSLPRCIEFSCDWRHVIFVRSDPSFKVFNLPS